ncbi:MAG: hypothetical protein LUP01_00335 [Methanothrix sp.]|jgi:hypothetical protein|nr:hypothetical protein [Methanothrix sp.]
MSGEENGVSDDPGLMGKKKSRLRQEVEETLMQHGISVERRISIINLETKESHYFDDYAQAMQFLKGKKGRWYLATPGIRR